MEDDEYIDNWVGHFNLLCENQYKVGLLGSMYFIGTVAFLCIVPPIADRYWRKAVFVWSNVVFIIAFFGLIVSTDLNLAYFWMFLLGATFSGKIIVGINYMIEFICARGQSNIIFVTMFTEPITLILLTMWYQFVDHSWFKIFVITLVFNLLALAFFVVYVPESARWYVTWSRFKEAREVLAKVAKFNGASDQVVERKILKAKFTNEVTARSEHDSMEDGQYYLNLVIVSILWTAAIFTFVLLSFLIKYLEGNIYLNFYLDGAAGIIGTLIA